MIFLFLALIFIKHWIADFILQFEYMVEQKGTYGLRGGIEHAAVHGIFTLILICVFLNNFALGVIFGLLDAVIHYHIDYVKARWGIKDPTKQKYWIQLGADQLAHSLCYIWLVWILQDIL